MNQNVQCYIIEMFQGVVKMDLDVKEYKRYSVLNSINNQKLGKYFFLFFILWEYKYNKHLIKYINLPQPT
jgi:hypothetical protein